MTTGLNGAKILWMDIIATAMGEYIIQMITKAGAMLKGLPDTNMTIKIVTSTDRRWISSLQPSTLGCLVTSSSTGRTDRCAVSMLDGKVGIPSGCAPSHLPTHPQDLVGTGDWSWEAGLDQPLVVQCKVD